MKGRVPPALPIAAPIKPPGDVAGAIPPGSRDRLRELGAERFAEWMKSEQRCFGAPAPLEFGRRDVSFRQACMFDAC